MKTSELTGRALAWAVGIAEGCRVETWHTKSVAILSPGSVPRAVPWNPHTDWSQGGPIIEREEISIKHVVPAMRDSIWQAHPSMSAKGAGGKWGIGPTPLIAAMRCFVASKLSDEVDVPEELK